MAYDTPSYLEPYKKDLYLGKGLFKYAFLNDSL